jgi:hypothetical protein
MRTRRQSDDSRKKSDRCQVAGTRARGARASIHEREPEDQLAPSSRRRSAGVVKLTKRRAGVVGKRTESASNAALELASAPKKRSAAAGKRSKRSSNQPPEASVSKLANSSSKLANRLVQKPILVVLPGASGALAMDMEDLFLPLLKDTFEVRVRPTKRWQGWDATKNAKAVVEELCPQEADAPAWYLLGASFGNRVAAAIVSERLTATPPSLIFTGTTC